MTLPRGVGQVTLSDQSCHKNNSWGGAGSARGVVDSLGWQHGVRQRR